MPNAPKVFRKDDTLELDFLKYLLDRDRAGVSAWAKQMFRDFKLGADESLNAITERASGDGPTAIVTFVCSISKAERSRPATPTKMPPDA